MSGADVPDLFYTKRMGGFYGKSRYMIVTSANCLLGRYES